ncbi:hypothetical protein HDU93_004610, partial [Gonapodya sp. JEL0774]
AIERLLTRDNSSMGVQCTFGTSSIKSSRSSTEDCRGDFGVEFVDWPFGVASSVCLSFNPGSTTTNRTATTRGTVMKIEGSGFHTNDDLRFMVHSKNSSYYPLQGQRIEIGSIVTNTFSRSSVSLIKNCNSDSNYDQLACYRQYEQSCITR